MGPLPGPQAKANKTVLEKREIYVKIFMMMGVKMVKNIRVWLDDGCSLLDITLPVTCPPHFFTADFGFKYENTITTLIFISVNITLTAIISLLV